MDDEIKKAIIELTAAVSAHDESCNIFTKRASSMDEYGRAKEILQIRLDFFDAAFPRVRQLCSIYQRGM